MTAVAYWDERYQSGLAHHAEQNRTISADFVAAAHERAYFRHLLSMPHLIEIGCGTGHLAALIKRTYQPETMLATDLSSHAIEHAERLNPGPRYFVFDILNDWPTPLRNFDVAISSNTLEHFSEWPSVLHRMLVLAEEAIVLVPYRQPITDRFDYEGGAGHAATFTVGSFRRKVRVSDWFTFETKGWQHSAKSEKPLQLAVAVTRK